VELADIRRLNAVAIMQENALDEMAFAMCLGKEEDQILALLSGDSKKKIGDALARLMEQTFSKPKLWLDQGDLESEGPSFDLFG